MNLININNQYTIEYTMKTLLSLLFFTFLFVGCTDNPSDLTSPDAQISQQSNPPNWIQLPTDLGQGFSVETVYSSERLIKGKNGGVIKLDVIIPSPGNPLGNFEVHANITVQKNSFPAQENRTFTVSLDPEYSILNITPSPSTLDKHLVIDLFVKGVDVTQINPDSFGFIFVGDNTEIFNTESATLLFNSQANWFKVNNAEIIAPTDQTSGGSRYGFTR